MASVRTLFKSIVNLPESPTLLQGDGDSIENDLVLSNGVNQLVLAVTLEEYTQILSALLNGAITTYPDNYNEIFYHLIKAGKVEFCEAMLYCLTNDADVINQIRNIIQEYLDSNTVIDQDVSRSGLAAAGDPNCDLDTIWGRVGKLTDFINQVNVDFFENIALLDNLSDKYEAIIDIIPVLGDAVEAVVNFATESFVILKDSYNASWNDGLRDYIACELFCMAVNNPSCTITIQDILDWLSERYNVVRQIDLPLASLSVRQSTITLTNLLVNIGGSVYSGDDLVYVCWIVQLSAIALGDQFFNINSAGTYYAEMLDSVPSPGWQSECDTCAEWELILEGTNAFGDIVVTRGAETSTEIVTEDFRSSGANQSAREEIYTLEITNTTTITEILVEHSYVKGNVASGIEGSAAKFIHDGTSYLIRQNFDDLPAGDSSGILSWGGTITAPLTLQFRLRSSLEQYANPVFGGSAATQKVTLRGTGDFPITTT